MARCLRLALAAGLAWSPAWAQLDFTVPNPLGEPWTMRPDAEELAIGDDQPLGPAEAWTLESELTAHGYTPGRVDGVIDQDTRTAIRDFQADAGLRPTGEPSVELLERLRLTALVPGEMGTNRPVADQQAELWARDLVGKTVHGSGTGEIGEVKNLIVGADNRINGVVVALEGAGGVDLARVPVPWEWVDHQIGRPSIVLPWTREDVEWLVGAADRARTSE